MTKYIPPVIHENCACQDIPRDVVDVVSPLYQAVGGRLYRIHATTEAKYVKMGAGGDVETRINLLEKNLLANSRVYFADNIAARDRIAPLTAGDCVFVTDASADPEVKNGSAMYLWLPRQSFQILYKGSSPLDAANLISDKSGLKVDENGKLYVDFSGLSASDRKIIIREIAADGGGLKVDENGKLALDAAKAAQALAGAGLTASGGKLAADPGQLAGTGLAASGGKLALDGASLAGPGVSWTNNKFQMDFADMTGSQRSAIVSAILSEGGGLEVGSDGKIRFNPEQMDTTVIENMMKTLRLPLWLNGNTAFYVDKNHANAGDSLIEGRGLSPDLPFESIRAAVNFAAQNYNVGNYVLTIHVASGSYGYFSCGEFSRVGGNIVVQGDGVVEVNNSDNPIGNTISVNGGVWHLKNLKVRNLRDRAQQTASTSSNSAAIMVNAGNCVIEQCDLECEISNNLPSGARPAQTNGLLVNIDGICSYFANSGTNFVGSVLQSEDTSGISPFYVYGSLEFTATGNAEVSNTLTVSNLTYSNFIVSNGGLVTVSAAWANKFKINATSCEGSRYRVVNSGKINTNNLGPEFFPGSSAGYVESSTNSWYK